MMAKAALAVVGASNLVVAFAAGAYMLAENDITLVPTLALVATLAAAFLAACGIESLDPFDKPFGDVANLPEVPTHSRGDTP